MQSLFIYFMESSFSTCETPWILQVIYFVKLLFNFVHIILPIGLIIYMMIDFSKCMLSNDESAQSKIVKQSFKRIMYAVLVYVVPYIVSIFASVLSDFVPDYNSCLANATPENIEIYTAQYEEAKEKEKSERNDAAIQKVSQKFTATKLEFTTNFDNLSQYDSEWQNYPLCKAGSTIRSAGCGYVSYTMVLRSLGYTDVQPQDVVDTICTEYKSNPSQYTGSGYEGSGLSYDMLASQALNDKYGLKAEWVDKSSAEAALKAGKSLIILMPGHWISVLDIDDNGKLLVGDSAFNFGSEYKYDINSLYKETANYRAPYGWHAGIAYSKK